MVCKYVVLGVLQDAFNPATLSPLKKGDESVSSEKWWKLTRKRLVQLSEELRSGEMSVAEAESLVTLRQLLSALKVGNLEVS